MSIGPRRSPQRRDAEHDLEKALDAMHATKADRVLARRTFAAMLDKAKPATLKGAIKSSLKAVDDSRQTSPDRPLQQA